MPLKAYALTLRALEGMTRRSWLDSTKTAHK